MKTFGVKFDTDIIKCIYITDPLTASKALKKLHKSSASIYGLDIETARAPGFEENHLLGGLSPYCSTIRLLTLYDPDSTIGYIFDFWFCGFTREYKTPEIAALQESLRSLLQTKRFVAQNATFDLMHLKHKGFPVKNCDCTVILSNLVYHAEEVSVGMVPSALNNLVERELKVNISKALQQSNWNREELSEEQLKYASLDSYLVVRLAKAYIPRLVEFKMERVYALNKDAQHVVVDMQLAGIRMHRKKHVELIYAWEKERFAMQEELEKTMYGVNLRSPKQMTAWLTANLKPEELKLWPHTDSGTYLSTDADTLQEYAYLDFVAPLAKYKYLDKLCGTYGRALYERRNPVTKRIHGGFTLARTHTGRMSSRDPNLQNFPRTKPGQVDFKSLFIPQKGYIFLCADYSQIELRVMAEVTGDPTMRKAYKNGKDLYILFAAAIFRKKMAQVTKEERQKAKAIVLGLQFGMGAGKLALYCKTNYSIDMSAEEAEDYFEMYHLLFAGYTKWKRKHTKICEATLRVRTPTGKLRKLHPDAFYSCGLNTPVQGGAAEIMLYALNYVRRDYERQKLDARIVISVHDEMVSEVRNTPETILFASEIMKTRMTAAAVKVFPKIITRDIVEVKSGMTWSAAK